MRYENLLKKYDITEQELEKGVNTVGKCLGKITNSMVMIALSELLTGGDIPAKEETEDN